MPVTDPIADMLTRIRNANAARKEEVEVPFSKLKWEIAKILKEEGYIKACFWNSKGKKKAPIKLYLKYGPNRESVLHGLERVSKPGIRRYGSVTDIPRVLNGMGISIISTSRGLLTDKHCRMQNVGGEILCNIW
ncbi:MAG: 30S ribosomal protein S8 [Candidatus Sumerlaeaceae bacterium]|nr:30S ribosomal protein S8 [Candidatus Sumerlaeaceae bacterium]